MKKLLQVIVLSSFIIPAFANASSDWTSVIQPIVIGCTGELALDNLSKAQKASIISKTVKKLGNDQSLTTYTLKNATAFGYPIQKLQKEVSYSPSETIYFVNDKFMALKKSNTNVDQFAKLSFNPKQKSISCSWNEGES